MKKITIEINEDNEVVSAYVEERINRYDCARTFNNTCIGWSNDQEVNLIFLKAQERYANEIVINRGHLFLNEVYDMLGIKRSKSGQLLGWVYDENKAVSFNYVPINSSDFILMFNVDGDILDKI